MSSYCESRLTRLMIDVSSESNLFPFVMRRGQQLGRANHMPTSRGVRGPVSKVSRECDPVSPVSQGHQGVVHEPLRLGERGLLLRPLTLVHYLPLPLRRQCYGTESRSVLLH